MLLSFLKINKIVLACHVAIRSSLTSLSSKQGRGPTQREVTEVTV